MIKKRWQLVKFKDKTRGGLTTAGVAQYRKENPNSNLKTGVDKTPATSEQIRRQGLFLTRTFGRFRKTGSKIKNPPPLVKKFKTKPDEPSRIALSAKNWNSPVPKTVAQARSLYQKGLGLLKRLKK
jgi:hypothetical protein